MLVNNEVGTIQPLAEVAALVRARARRRPLLHTDAVQAVPWLDVAAADRRLRPRGDLRPQVRRPEGRRRARRAQRRDARSPRSRAAARSAVCGPGRSTSPARSRSPPRCGSPTSGAPTDVERVRRAARPAAARSRSTRSRTSSFNGDPDAKVAGNCHVGVRRARVRGAAREPRRGRRLRRRGFVVLVGRDRAVARARGDGPVARRRARVGPVQPRLRVDRTRTSRPRSTSCPRASAQLRRRRRHEPSASGCSSR